MNFCWLGYITSKDALPVTKLNFGRTLTTSSYGIHTLGKLECSGRATVDRMAESCDDLWKIGHTLNGFYDVKGDKQVRSVYCDFTKLPGDPGARRWTSSCFHFIHFFIDRNGNCSWRGRCQIIASLLPRSKELNVHLKWHHNSVSNRTIECRRGNEHHFRHLHSS